MLKFNRETKWGDFLDAYLDATQRKPGFEQGEVTVELSVDSLPARRTPPYGKGGGPTSASIKNHPTSPLLDDIRPVRRTPPYGKGGHKTAPSIKNHPSADVSADILGKHR